MRGRTIGSTYGLPAIASLTAPRTRVRFGDTDICRLYGKRLDMDVIVLGANLADARQRVRKLRERDRAVHAKVI